MLFIYDLYRKIYSNLFIITLALHCLIINFIIVPLLIHFFVINLPVIHAKLHAPIAAVNLLIT